jgi:hypothetical protein
MDPASYHLARLIWAVGMAIGLMFLGRSSQFESSLGLGMFVTGRVSGVVYVRVPASL